MTRNYFRRLMHSGHQNLIFTFITVSIFVVTLQTFNTGCCEQKPLKEKCMPGGGSGSGTTSECTSNNKKFVTFTIPELTTFNVPPGTFQCELDNYATVINSNIFVDPSDIFINPPQNTSVTWNKNETKFEYYIIIKAACTDGKTFEKVLKHSDFNYINWPAFTGNMTIETKEAIEVGDTPFKATLFFRERCRKIKDIHNGDFCLCFGSEMTTDSREFKSEKSNLDPSGSTVSVTFDIYTENLNKCDCHL